MSDYHNIRTILYVALVCSLLFSPHFVAFVVVFAYEEA